MHLEHTGVSVIETWPLKGVRLSVFCISFLTNSSISIYISDFRVLEELTMMDSKNSNGIRNKSQGHPTTVSS